MPCSKTSGKYREEPMAHAHEGPKTLQYLSVCSIPKISRDTSSVTSEHTWCTHLVCLFPLLWDSSVYLPVFFEGTGFTVFHLFIPSFIYSVKIYSLRASYTYIRHCSMQWGYCSKKNMKNYLISRTLHFSKGEKDNKPINR